MRRLLTAALACTLAAASGLSRGVFAQAAPATLTIDAGKPLHAVSPTLYGMMTEEINYSYDGGLYAEKWCATARLPIAAGPASADGTWTAPATRRPRLKYDGDHRSRVTRCPAACASTCDGGRRGQSGGRAQRRLVGHGTAAETPLIAARSMQRTEGAGSIGVSLVSDTHRAGSRQRIEHRRGFGSALEAVHLHTEDGEHGTASAHEPSAAQLPAERARSGSTWCRCFRRRTRIAPTVTGLT